jgi:glycosyltransferase involved in cell wall biosynthesis
MKFLIFSLDSYSVFHTDTKYIFGGAEIETGYHARGLAEKQVEVVVVTRDQGVAAHTFENILLVPHTGQKGNGYWEKRKTLKGRILYRLLGDKKAKYTDEEIVAAINPDAAYIMGISREALNLSRYCKRNGKPFIYRIAHDLDLGGENPDDEKMKKWGNYSMKEAGEIVSNASIVLTQTPYQNKLLKENFGKDGVMMFPPIGLDADLVPSSAHLFDVLWIGKNNTFKRPEKLAELARLLPHRKFCMIFNRMEVTSWNEIVAALPDNVQVIESVPADEIEKKFRESKVFVSTSLHEGFANTFLQAAKNFVPVVSMGPDPNEMISGHGAGILVGDDMTLFAESVEELLNNNDKRLAIAMKSRTFVENHHDKNMISQQFYELLNRIGNAVSSS